MKVQPLDQLPPQPPQVVLQRPARVAGQRRVDVGVLGAGAGLELRRPLLQLLPGLGPAVLEAGGLPEVLVVVEERSGAAVGEGPLLAGVLVVGNEGLLEVVDLEVELLSRPSSGVMLPLVSSGTTRRPRAPRGRAGLDFAAWEVWNFCAISS